MNARWIVTVSCLSGSILGCGEILGLDDNKPVFDCGRCHSGYRCDERKLRCVPTAGAAGELSAGYDGRELGGEAGLSNGGLGGVVSGAGQTGNPPSGGQDTGTRGIAATTTGSGGVATGGSSSSGGTESVGGSAGTTVAGTGGYLTGGSGEVTTGGGGIGGGVAGSNTDTACKLSITPWPPPAPCRGVYYDVSFSVEEGPGDASSYQWEASAIPRGMTFDNNSHHLSGVPEAAGELGLTLRDGAGLCTVRKSELLQPRDSCWLAYISSESERARLRLYDPVLGEKYRACTYRVTYPSTSSETDDVTDYKFSHDGRLLAVRLAARRLILLHSPGWSDKVLDFGGAPVVDYVWSPNSAVLAVTLGDDAGQVKSLSGVRVASTPSSSTVGGSAGAPAGFAGSAGLIEPTNLTAISATVGPDSQLVWFGNGRFLAYHAPDEEEEYLHFAELGESGFYSDIPLMDSVSFTPSVYLVPTEDGFWTVESKNGVYFWSVPDPSRKVAASDVKTYAHAFPKPTDPEREADDLVVSPSARLSGRKWPVNAPAEFRLYGPQQPAVEKFRKSAQACPTFLAWAKQFERLACVADTQNTSVVRIFDPGNSNSSVVQGTDIGNNEYVYLENDAYPRRRAFSAQGGWFAFTSTSAIYVADLSSNRVIHQSDPVQATDAVEFSFSPNDKWLVTQRDSALSIRWLNYKNSYSATIVSNANVSNMLACTPVYMDNPDAWCGRPGVYRQLPWSPDSRWMAHLSNVGNLHILDTSLMPTRSVFQVNVTSESNCRQPDFQPQIPDGL